MNLDLRNVTALVVNLHGRRVGAITRLVGDRQIFAFDQAYADDPARPTLSLSFKGSSGLITSIQQVHRRVPPFFSNLLPEGHLRTYLAERAGTNPEREFFLLAALGVDLPGAVSISPLDMSDSGPATKNEAFEIETRGLTPGTGTLRFSLAGVQLKFSAVMETTGGLTIPAEGVGGSWIVKLPSTRFEAVSENEFVMLELARAIGIDVPRIQLVPVTAITGLPAEMASVKGNALAVQRFDRGPGRSRIHMEDFAQVFGLFPDSKYKSVSYANMARVLWAETGERGAYEFVKRLAFSVLIGNADMHLKNWSLLYPDTRTPVLSPAYDFVSTLPYISTDKLALTLGGTRDIGGISVDQMRRFADKASLPIAPIARIVRDTVEATVTAWHTLVQKDLLPLEIREVVHKQIEGAAARTKAF